MKRSDGSAWPHRTQWSVALFCALFSVGVACGSSLPAPPFAKQTTSALVAVPYSPPPARVEIVPDSPERGAVWIDGEWTWRGKRWRWVRGRWTMVPSGAKFCPFATARGKDGTFYMAQGKFCNDRGEELPAPNPLAYATDVGGSVVDPEGNIVETGRALPPNVEKRLRAGAKEENRDEVESTGGDAGPPPPTLGKDGVDSRDDAGAAAP